MQHQQAASQRPRLQQLQHPAACPGKWLSSFVLHASSPCQHVKATRQVALQVLGLQEQKEQLGPWAAGLAVQVDGMGWERAMAAALWRTGIGRASLHSGPDFSCRILRLRTRALECMTREVRMGQPSPLRALPVSSSTFTLSFLSLQDLSWLVRARTPTPDSLGALHLYTQASLIRGLGRGQSYPPQPNPSSPSVFS